MESKLRIGYLAPPLAKSAGWRSHARGFLESISRQVDPVILAAAEDEEVARELFRGQEVRYLPCIQQFGNSPRTVAPSVLRTALALVRYREALRLDIVHSLEAYPTGLVGHVLSRLINKPHVITAHGTYAVAPVESRLHRTLYRQVLRGANALCPVSPETGQLISDAFPDISLDDVIFPVLNGNDFHLKVCRGVASNRAPVDPPMLLSVGAFKKRKGQDLSIRAFQQAKKEIPSLRYRLIGTVDDRKFFEGLLAYVEQQGLRDDVEFIPDASDEILAESYRTASVFVLTPRHVRSRFEGFGLVFLEAGAYGIPVIGSRSGGVPSAVLHGETGLIVPSDDVMALAKSMETLTTNWDLNKMMGLRNRAWSEELTWDRNAESTMKVYRTILDRRTSDVKTKSLCRSVSEAANHR